MTKEEAVHQFLDEIHHPLVRALVPSEIAAAYRKLEHRMSANGYADFIKDLKMITTKINREEMDFLLAVLYHPLLRPGAMKVIYESYNEGTK